MGSEIVVKGQNVRIHHESTSVRISARWLQEARTAEVDLVALVLGPDRRVRSDTDMIFYNQSSTTNGSVVHSGKVTGDGAGSDELIVDLETLDENTACIAVAASVDGATFGELDRLELDVFDGPGEHLISYPVTGLATETAVVLGEVYRRDDAWRFRAVGQGWSSGLAGLATDFGVNIDDDPPSESEQAQDPESTTADFEPQEPSRSEGPDSEQPVLEADPPPTSFVQPGESVPPSPPRRRRDVRVRKDAAKRAVPPVFTLADDDQWQSARMFSVSAVGGSDEQEKRATSALLWTMSAVRPLARAVTARAGAPTGVVETYLETQFSLGDRTVIPDGLVRVARGTRVWTALVEVKTSDGTLRREQLESYAAVAKKRKFDAVLTISNEVSADPDVHPVELSARATGAITLVHLSWSEVMHEIRTLLAHHEFTDALQVWILSELLRYLEHPRSGAVAFNDMGAAWVAVRESVAAGTLRSADRKVEPVVSSWHKLCRQIALGLSARLGVAVKQTLPRKILVDPQARSILASQLLADQGLLTTTFKVPGATGAIGLVADVRTSKITVSLDVPAPAEGTALRRVGWLVRQLKTAPDWTLIEAYFAGREASTCERLADVRVQPSILLPPREEPTRFRVAVTSPMGTKRSGANGSFVFSVNTAFDAFYQDVAANIRPWTSSRDLSEPVPADDNTGR